MFIRDLKRERKDLKKRRTSTTRLRVEALECKEITKKMPLERENKSHKKEVSQLRVCVSRHRAFQQKIKMPFRRE